MLSRLADESQRNRLLSPSLHCAVPQEARRPRTREAPRIFVLSPSNQACDILIRPPLGHCTPTGSFLISTMIVLPPPVSGKEASSSACSNFRYSRRWLSRVFDRKTEGTVRVIAQIGVGLSIKPRTLLEVLRLSWLRPRPEKGDAECRLSSAAILAATTLAAVAQEHKRS